MTKEELRLERELFRYKYTTLSRDTLYPSEHKAKLGNAALDRALQCELSTLTRRCRQEVTSIKKQQCNLNGNKTYVGKLEDKIKLEKRKEVRKQKLKEETEILRKTAAIFAKLVDDTNTKDVFQTKRHGEFGWIHNKNINRMLNPIIFSDQYHYRSRRNEATKKNTKLPFIRTKITTTGRTGKTSKLKSDKLIEFPNIVFAANLLTGSHL